MPPRNIVLHVLNSHLRLHACQPSLPHFVAASRSKTSRSRVKTEIRCSATLGQMHRALRGQIAASLYEARIYEEKSPGAIPWIITPATRFEAQHFPGGRFCVFLDLLR